MNNSWHPDCFCCDICQAVLADVGFVKNAGRSVPLQPVTFIPVYVYFKAGWGVYIWCFIWYWCFYNFYTPMSSILKTVSSSTSFQMSCRKKLGCKVTLEHIRYFTDLSSVSLSVIFFSHLFLSLPSGTCVVHATTERKPGASASTSVRSVTPLSRSSLSCSRMTHTTLITSTATTAGKHAHTHKPGQLRQSHKPFRAWKGSGGTGCCSSWWMQAASGC